MPTMEIKAGPTGLVREMVESHATGEMRVMGSEGDTRVTWNARDADEVEAARRQFNELRGKGFMAYSVTEGGSRREQLREFDPDAQKVILAPPLAGG